MFANMLFQEKYSDVIVNAFTSGIIIVSAI